MQIIAPQPVLRLAERTSTGRLLLGALLGSGLPLLGIPFAPLVGDLALVGTGILVLAGGGWTAWVRHRLMSMPLVVGPLGLYSMEVTGMRYRFAVWLGRGRPMSKATARVTFTPRQGAPRNWKVDAPVASLVGPWVLTVDVPLQLPPGEFSVEAEVHEGNRTWTAAGTFDTSQLKPGHFHPGFSGSPIRLSVERFGTLAG